MTLIDDAAIEAITSLQKPGKPDLFAKIVTLFEQNSPSLIESIVRAPESDDADSARAAAHSLKSSSAYLGAVEFSGLCKRIESAARENDLSRELEAIERLPDCFKETIEALQPYLQKAA